MKTFQKPLKVLLSSIATCNIVVLLILFAAPPAMAQVTSNPSGCKTVSSCYKKKNLDTGDWYCNPGCNDGCGCKEKYDTGGALASCYCD